MFNFDYSSESDVLSINLVERNCESFSRQVFSDCIVDLDDAGRVVALKIFFASSKYPYSCLVQCDRQNHFKWIDAYSLDSWADG